MVVTYGGNPLVTSAALAVIETCENDKLAARATALSKRIISGFKDKLKDNNAVVDIRAKGLMIGIQLDRPCAELVKAGLDAGILINVTAGDVVRLLPPLIITDEQADKIVELVSELISKFVA
jgi:acetylornithine aminotransferase